MLAIAGPQNCGPSPTEAAGRDAADMLTPYPPGIRAVLPDERLTEPVPRYLR
ncbi:hypothetical protein ABZT43_38890 [Streptomyces sp. NPDC005349]|uniref:Orn/Lys/Arg family decarboxylase n=1 Tax=unclassified Streptomyces TaxID=2593676 RepID=UPI0033B8C881